LIRICNILLLHEVSSTTKHRCARCGKRLKKGGGAYRLKAELTSHFDGYIGVNQRESLASILDKVNSQLEKLTEDEIENQVYRKFEYIVCPPCRDEVESFLRPEDSR
jgi:DNA-directed RNA polymerase subunit RPC12/RpoP